jgi:hypothetical protein
MNENEIKDWVIDRLQHHMLEYHGVYIHDFDKPDEKPQFGQWQPIETAPKDGSDILLYEVPAGKTHIGYFSPVTDMSKKWGNHYGYGFDPSHWMPLPEPPKED